MTILGSRFRGNDDSLDPLSRERRFSGPAFAGTTSGWGSLPAGVLRDEQIRRNSERVSERADLLDLQPPLAGEEFRDTRLPTHQWRQIGACHLSLLEHERSNALRRPFGLVDGMVFILICFDEH